MKKKSQKMKDFLEEYNNFSKYEQKEFFLNESLRKSQLNRSNYKRLTKMLISALKGKSANKITIETKHDSDHEEDKAYSASLERKQILKDKKKRQLKKHLTVDDAGLA